MTDERIEIFKEYLRKWDFGLMPLMPIGEPEAEWLLSIIDEKDKRTEKRHEYYVANRDTFIRKAKESYEKKKAEVFIKGAKHD